MFLFENDFRASTKTIRGVSANDKMKENAEEKM